jgi:hypothetical protein
MKFKSHETGIIKELIKELLKEIKVIDKRLKRVERILPVERLTEADLRNIKKSEGEIRKGKYRTISQVKKELGILTT